MHWGELNMRKKVINGGMYFMALILLVIQVFPLLWIFMTSLKTTGDFRSSNPFALPEKVSFENFQSIIEKGDIFIYFKNSIIITVSAVLLIVILSGAAAFAISKFTFRICKIANMYFMLGIMIPVQISLIPLFQIYNKIHLKDSYISVIIPQVGFALPVAVFLFAAFYEYIPEELYETSVIDGCNITQMFFKIVLPMSKNTVVTVMTINAISIWNEFMITNTLINNAKLKTLPLGLYDYIGEHGYIDWGQTFAAVSISVAPTLLIYFFLNKKIISGMAAGAVKN